MVKEALKAAEELEKEGISAEVVDLRSIRPFDADTVIKSVNKTGRLVVVQEANLCAGFGAEVAATVQNACFKTLKAPIQRIGAPNVPVPFSPVLEKAYLPNSDKVIAAVKACLQ